MPDPPAGSLYSIYASKGKLLCADVQTGATCPTITVAQADKFYAMDPLLWKNLENYIDELIALIKQGGGVNPSMVGGGVLVRPDDVQQFKDQMWFLRKTMEQRRKSGK